MENSKLQQVLAKTRNFQLKIRAVDASDSSKIVIEGIASTPDVDSYDSVIEPTAYAESMRAYFSKNPVVLLQHKMDKPIGKVVEYGITDKLSVRAEITENLDGVFSAITNGVLRGFSLGFNPVSYDFVMRDGKEVVVFTRIDIKEISVVSIPANENTLFSLQRSMQLIGNEIREAMAEGQPATETQGEAAAPAPEIPAIVTEPATVPENAAETPAPTAPVAAEGTEPAKEEGVKAPETAPVAAVTPAENAVPDEAPTVPAPTAEELAAAKSALEASEAKAAESAAALAKVTEELAAAKASAAASEAKSAELSVQLDAERKAKGDAEQRMAKMLTHGRSTGTPASQASRAYCPSLVEIARRVNL